jgi:3-dehydroquinate synthetase
MAEIIKTAAFWDGKLFERLEANVELLKSGENNRLLREIIWHSVGIKADIVLEDERESGLRGLLNFGHTIGHAVEGL